LQELCVNVNRLFYPNYPNRQKWGDVNYAIQTSWKKGICEERREMEAEVNNEVCKERKKDG